MATNLFDYFDDIATEEGAASARWAPRSPYEPDERFDLMLVPRVRGWQEDPDSLSDLERFEAEPWVEQLTRNGKGVWARLDSGWIERSGSALEAGEDPGSPLTEIAGGQRYALNFWDANSTKALHIGHLRNLALGNALGGALEEAGAKVERRSIICDVGRSMGEAMAGVVQSGRHTQSWPDGGQKSDHFVGYCYADYVKSGRAGSGEGDPEDSLARELDLQNDSADQLLQRVLDGDQQAIELWSKTRAWVISGQRKTLARLGIAFDRVFFESDFLPEVGELTELGLREGMLHRCPDGAVIYATGREELDEMALMRADGLPTQHMRALAYWTAAPGLDEEMHSIQICGAEWVAHVTCRRKLMAELAEAGGGNGTIHPKHDVFHEMVSKERQSISSSKKDAVLIDDLAEWIDASSRPRRSGPRFAGAIPRRSGSRHRSPSASSSCTRPASASTSSRASCSRPTRASAGTWRGPRPETATPAPAGRAATIPRRTPNTASRSSSRRCTGATCARRWRSST